VAMRWTFSRLIVGRREELPVPVVQGVDIMQTTTSPLASVVTPLTLSLSMMCKLMYYLSCCGIVVMSFAFFSTDLSHKFAELCGVPT